MTKMIKTLHFLNTDIEVLVNFDNITYMFVDARGDTTIHLVGGDDLQVTETPHEIMRG